jgi:hypothetical protein
MYHLAIEFARWLQSTKLGVGILESGWAYPYVQWMHFTGLSLWIGTNMLLDLRLIGVGKKLNTIPELFDALFVWNWIGFFIGITGGFLLFSTGAIAFVENSAFQVKLAILIPLGLILHIFVQSQARKWGQAEETPGIARLMGFVELLVWLAVVTSAILIPYFAAEP